MSRVGRHTLVYGAGVLLSKAVSFIMLPVYTRFLTPADYGVMELIGMTLEIIAIVAGTKLALGIFRYYHKAETDAERNAVVSTAMTGLGASYAIVGLLSFLAAGQLSTLIFGTTAHAPLIRLAAMTLALQSLMIVPLAYARLRGHAMLFVVSNLAKLTVGLGLNILFVVHLRMGVQGVFLANLIATLVVGVTLGVYVVRSVGMAYSPKATRDLLRYGVPLIGTQLAAFLLTFGDRYFLKAAADETAVGLYSLAYQFGFLLAAIGYIPFEAVWEPARFQIAKRPDRDVLFNKGFRYMNVVLLTTAVGLSLFVPDLLRVMAAPAFHGAATLVPLILVAYILQGWTQIQDIGILVSERTGFHTLANWIAAAIALAGYAVLVPRYLGFGAALSTLVAFAVRYGIIYTVSQRLWPVRYEWRPILMLSAVALSVGVAGVMVHSESLVVSLAVRAALLGLYLIALWYQPILTETDRAFIRRFVLTPRAGLASLRAGV